MKLTKKYKRKISKEVLRNRREARARRKKIFNKGIDSGYALGLLFIPLLNLLFRKGPDVPGGIAIGPPKDYSHLGVDKSKEVRTDITPPN